MIKNVHEHEQWIILIAHPNIASIAQVGSLVLSSYGNIRVSFSFQGPFSKEIIKMNFLSC